MGLFRGRGDLSGAGDWSNSSLADLRRLAGAHIREREFEAAFKGLTLTEGLMGMVTSCHKLIWGRFSSKWTTRQEDRNAGKGTLEDKDSFCHLTMIQ